MSNVQIPEELFMLLCRHHLAGTDLSDRIQPMLERKLDAVVQRELYCKMCRQDLTPAEREAARQAYLCHKLKSGTD